MLSPLARAAETFPVAVRIDAEKSLGPLKSIWRFFGADEPNYATMPNGEKLLANRRRQTPCTSARTIC